MHNTISPLHRMAWDVDGASVPIGEKYMMLHPPTADAICATLHAELFSS